VSIDTTSVPGLRREQCRGSSAGAVRAARVRGKPAEGHSAATQSPRWHLRPAERWRKLRQVAGQALALTIVVYVADLAGARTAWAGIITPESGGSSNAESIEGLYRIVLIIAAVIFCAVAGTLVYFLVKYRARRGQVASQVRGNTRLEIAWTGAAALILVVLAVLTFSRLHGIVTPAASADDAAGAVFATVDQPAAPSGHALHIKITGRQFVWRFEYPNGAYSYEELVVPVGTTVVADIYAADVNHSWWVPKLGGKFDAIPGYVNHTWFKITRAGVFVGQCAELCGQHHAQMIATVRAIPLAAWESWLDRQKQLITEAHADDQAAKAKLDSQVGAAQVENP
jgi:cytochrome c oxidase subunit II